MNLQVVEGFIQELAVTFNQSALSGFCKLKAFPGCNVASPRKEQFYDEKLYSQVIANLGNSTVADFSKVGDLRKHEK